MTNRYSHPRRALAPRQANVFSKVTARLLLGGIALVCMASAPAICLASQAQLTLPRVQLGAGMHIIDAQVATTPQQREIGLMYRTEMPQNEGMLFVFEHPDELCFWMKNTVLPLTAAFIADDGSIVNLEDMAPNTTDAHCSKKPVRFVLEMNHGWFKKKGLREGGKVTGAPFRAQATK